MGMDVNFWYLAFFGVGALSGYAVVIGLRG
jgi:hypothetical protein